MNIPTQDTDRQLAAAAASVKEMYRQVAEAKRMLAAAAISSGNDLVIYDGAVSRVNLYEVVMTRDEEIGGLRISVRPRG